MRGVTDRAPGEIRGGDERQQGGRHRRQWGRDRTMSAGRTGWRRPRQRLDRTWCGRLEPRGTLRSSARRFGVAADPHGSVRRRCGASADDAERNLDRRAMPLPERGSSCAQIKCAKQGSQEARARAGCLQRGLVAAGRGSTQLFELAGTHVGDALIGRVRQSLGVRGDPQPIRGAEAGGV